MAVPEAGHRAVVRGIDFLSVLWVGGSSCTQGAVAIVLSNST